eukprot:symbB.v1.2.002094.t1/scaffold109.1/size325261/12
MSRSLLQHCVSSFVLPDLDAGHHSLDHFAVINIVDWPSSLHRPPKSKVRWDRSKLQHADETTWQSFFEGWPDIPWATDPTTHMSIIEAHLHDRLTKFFPHDAGNRRNSCLDGDALDTMKQKIQLKKTMTIAKKQCDNHRLHAAITCWHSQQIYGIKLQEILCVLRTIWRWRRYGTLTRSIKQMVLRQKAQWLEKQISPLQHMDRKSALTALKPLRMGKRVKDLGKKPLQQVKLIDDQLASTPAEAMSRWRQHFADLEGGKQVTLPQLWEEAVQRLQKNPHPPEHIDEVPTLLEVERHLQHAAVGKAMGCDLLPGELMRLTAPWMAEAIWPIVTKTGATAMQFTAQPKALVTQASHCVRMFLRSQIARRSCYAMFLDIQAAYYRLIRQHSINSDFSDASILQFLERMGVAGLSIQDLATILQGPNALEELDCPHHLQKIVATLHASTWWRLDADQAVIRTERGTRPGDGFADVVWQLCFSRYLHRVDEILASLGIQCQLPWNQCNGFLTGSGDTQLPLGTVVWADDAALLGSTATADQAIPQLQVVAEVALRELEKLGMQPNMGKGKTEALIHLTGRGSRRVRQYLHHHCGSKIRFKVGQEELALRIVPTYIHLGGVVTHDGSMKVEIKRNPIDQVRQFGRK